MQHTIAKNKGNTGAEWNGMGQDILEQYKKSGTN